MKKLVITLIMFLGLCACEDKYKGLIKLEKHVSTMADINTYTLEFDQYWKESQEKYKNVKAIFFAKLNDNQFSVEILNGLITSFLQIYNLNSTYLISASIFYGDDFKESLRIKKVIYKQYLLKLLMQEMTILYAEYTSQAIEQGQDPFSLKTNLDDINKKIQDTTFNNTLGIKKLYSYFHPPQYLNGELNGLSSKVSKKQENDLQVHGLEAHNFYKRKALESELERKRKQKEQQNLRNKKAEARNLRLQKESDSDFTSYVDTLYQEITPYTENGHYYDLSIHDSYNEIRYHLYKYSDHMSVGYFQRVLTLLITKYISEKRYKKDHHWQVYDSIDQVRFGWIRSYVDTHKGHLSEKGFVRLLNHFQIDGAKSVQSWKLYCQASKSLTCIELKSEEFDSQLINTFRIYDYKDYRGEQFYYPSLLPKKWQ